MSRRARTRRLQAGAVLLAVFLSGGLAGVAFERLSSESTQRSARPFARPLAPGALPSFFEELDLSDGQRERIEAILERARPESDSLLRIAMPRLRRITIETREAIREVLTPEQRARLDELDGRRGDRRSAPPGDRPGRRHGAVPPPGDSGPSR